MFPVGYFIKIRLPQLKKNTMNPFMFALFNLSFYTVTISTFEKWWISSNQFKKKYPIDITEINDLSFQSVNQTISITKLSEWII